MKIHFISTPSRVQLETALKRSMGLMRFYVTFERKFLYNPSYYRNDKKNKVTFKCSFAPKLN